MIFNVTGGGGAALNFKVVAYATEEALLAATPAENAIGIITETPITGRIFSVEEPSPATAGMVWVTIGTSSQVAFNALKKDTVMVYPLSAKQYVDGAWVDVTAKSYQGGEWVDWKLYLYNSGFFATGQSLVYQTNAGTTITENGDSINYKQTSNSGMVYQYFANPVDLTDKSTVTMKIHSNAEYNNTGTAGYEVGVGLYIDPDTSNDWTSTNVKQKKLAADADYELRVDVSNLSGEYYIWPKIVYANSGSGTLDVDLISVEVE